MTARLPETSLQSEELNEKESAASVVRFVTSRKFWILLGVLLLCAAVAAIVLMRQMPQNTPAASALRTPVLTVTASGAAKRPVSEEVVVTGSISAWDPVAIASEVSGLLIKTINVEEGTTVKKGQVLATLNSSVLRAQLLEEKARLAASAASLNKAKQPWRLEELQVTEAQLHQSNANIFQERANLAQAKANLKNARQNAVRYRGLLAQGAVSEQEVEARDTTAKVAEEQVRSAEQKVKAAEFAAQQSRERLSMVESGGRTEDIAIARAELEQRKASVARLEAQIAQTIIRAPDDGLISKREGHIGDTSTAGKPLFYMVRGSRLELKANVPEKDLFCLKPGQPVIIRSDATGLARFEGRVREIRPEVEIDTRLGTVRIDVPSNLGLKPGMFVEGRVALGEHSALTVPSQSVISRDNRHLVYVVEGDQVHERQVVTGARAGDYVEVMQGLSEGEPVVVAGAGFLKDGDIVSVSTQETTVKP